MSSLIRSIAQNSPRIHRASVGLVILTSLAAFALRAVAPTPSTTVAVGLHAALPVTR